MSVTNQQLIEQLRVDRPHVVVLGAGASLAAFPNGDANGKLLPLMANIVELLELQNTIDRAGHDPTLDFESLYSQLHTIDPNSGVVKEIERRVEEYFAQLALPEHTTIYDLLILSLRKKDAIFTFNWDPFLLDAHERNLEIDSRPHIFHLHGNVRVGYCKNCDLAGRKSTNCVACQKPLTSSRLLYPVEEKNYADDPFIASQWERAHEFIRSACVITIFGYSAPGTDQKAMEIFKMAWNEDESLNLLKQLEIVDIRDREELTRQWSPFAHFRHYDVRDSFGKSMLARYPRRTCEFIYHTGVDGNVVDEIKWAGSTNGVLGSLDDAQASINGLLEYES